MSDLSQDEATKLAFGEPTAKPAAPANAPAPDESRTLAPARERQQEFATDREALASPGAQQASQLPNGRWVTGGEAGIDRALAGSSNASDQLEFIRRTAPQLWNQAAYGPHGPQGGQAPDARLMAQLMGMGQQAARGIFEGDTQRGVAGVQEFQQKVRGREEDQLKRDLASQEGANKLELAGRAEKSALKTAQAQAASQIAASQMTPEEKRAALQMQGEAIRSISDAARPGGGAAPRIQLTPGPDGTPITVGPPGGTAKQLADATATGNLLRRLGLLPPQAGQQPGKWDVNALTTDLANNPAAASDPAVLDALMKGMPGVSREKLHQQLLARFASLGGALTDVTNPNADLEFGGARLHRRPGMLAVTSVNDANTLLGQRNFLEGGAGPQMAGWAEMTPAKSPTLRRQYTQQASALGNLLRALQQRGAFGQ